MQLIKKRKIPDSLCEMLPPEEPVDQAQQDEIEAHLAWVTTERFHELLLKESFAEIPVYYRVN